MTREQAEAELERLRQWCRCTGAPFHPMAIVCFDGDHLIVGDGFAFGPERTLKRYIETRSSEKSYSSKQLNSDFLHLAS